MFEIVIFVVFFYPSIQMAVNGTTGPIGFDDDGLRGAFNIEVIEAQTDSNERFKTIAKYQCPSVNNTGCDPSYKKIDSTDYVEYLQKQNVTTSEGLVRTSLKGQKIKVIMRLGDPYLILK